jgi:hypothetical protein
MTRIIKQVKPKVLGKKTRDSYIYSCATRIYWRWKELLVASESKWNWFIMQKYILYLFNEHYFQSSSLSSDRNLPTLLKLLEAAHHF